MLSSYLYLPTFPFKFFPGAAGKQIPPGASKNFQAPESDETVDPAAKMLGLEKTQGQHDEFPEESSPLAEYLHSADTILFEESATTIHNESDFIL